MLRVGTDDSSEGWCVVGELTYSIGQVAREALMPRKSHTENVRKICGCAKWKTCGGAM
jgi:hypothetical protein